VACARVNSTFTFYFINFVLQIIKEE